MSVRLHVTKEVRKASLAGIPGTAAGGGGGGAGGPGGVSGGGGGSGGGGAPGAPGAPGTNGTNGTNGVGVPTGGTIHQVLTKTSGTDYATDWETPAAGVNILRIFALGG
jgi:hypothetical protein